jgi:two-component system sensor histidine kinase YesM
MAVVLLFSARHVFIGSYAAKRGDLMKLKLNIFGKVIILVFVILIPVIILYGYSYYKSIGVVRKEIQISNLNRLSFFSSQLDTSVNQLSTILNTLSTDSSIIELAYSDLSLFNNYYNITTTKKILEEKLRIQSLSSNWGNRLAVYAPGSKQFISSNRSEAYDMRLLHGRVSPDWTYYADPDGKPQGGQFIRYITKPYFAYKDLDNALIIFEVSFPVDNIVNMLNQFKAGGKGDPFLYHPGDKPIVNGTADSKLIQELIGKFSGDPLHGKTNEIMRLDGRDYLVYSIKMNSIGWYLIDYVPLGEILSPIKSTRNLFYFSTGLLLLMGILASYLVYRHVQLPIARLIQSVKKVEQGDFSTRVSMKWAYEFHYLFTRFNQMTEQIRQLIENVYEERIRSREATLKQLQSQINPHFLYNCLAFIKSMTQLGEKESVIAMVTSLGKYYRYTTRVENQTVTVREELDLVNSYLMIQNLQMERIQYEIEVPEQMMELPIPRLILQPIVENAVIHGIEPKRGTGRIVLTGSREKGACRIIVEDDGVGLEPEALDALVRKLPLPMDDRMGTGVWNVHQRLVHQFGSDAGLRLSRSVMGGLRVELRWSVKADSDRREER